MEKLIHLLYSVSKKSTWRLGHTINRNIRNTRPNFENVLEMRECFILRKILEMWEHRADPIISCYLMTCLLLHRINLLNYIFLNFFRCSNPNRCASTRFSLCWNFHLPKMRVLIRNALPVCNCLWQFVVIPQRKRKAPEQHNWSKID